MRKVPKVIVVTKEWQMQQHEDKMLQKKGLRDIIAMMVSYINQEIRRGKENKEVKNSQK